MRLIVKNGKSRKEKEKKEREKYKHTLNWQDSNSRFSVSCHELLAPRAGNFTTQPRNYNYIGVLAGGGGEERLSPSDFGQLRFFGQEEKFGQSQFLKKFHVFLLFRKDRYFLF